MTHDQLIKLKDGDIIRNQRGDAYLVLRNTGHCVIASRTLEVSNASEWDHVYTTVRVPEPAPAPPGGLSLVEIIAEIERLGWTFDVPKNEWTSPNGFCKTRQIRTAWDQRHFFNKREAAIATQIPAPRPVKSFADARNALKNSGWKNVYGRVWLSPTGQHYEGTLAAYRAWRPPEGDCNAS